MRQVARTLAAGLGPNAMLQHLGGLPRAALMVELCIAQDTHPLMGVTLWKGTLISDNRVTPLVCTS